MTIRIELPVGRDRWPLTVRPDALVRPVPAEAAPSAPPRELVRAALEAPLGLNAPLRAALTPDDRIAVVADPRLPNLADFVAAVMEHLGSAGIAPAAVTLVLPPGAASGDIGGLTTEVHDPADRKRLAYLATTAGGRRVYLNRTLVEADFAIILTGRGYDPTLGYSGAEAAVFPTLSDTETRAALLGKPTGRPPKPPEETTEARETLWLLGTPLLVQAIAGPGDTVAGVVAGLPDSSDDGRTQNDARWRYTIGERPDLVVCAVAGDPARADFAALAAAAACGARVVAGEGRVAVLSTAAPLLGETEQRLLAADEPGDVVKPLRKQPGAAAAYLWALAARRARLFVAAGWPDDVIESLFATPVASAAEVQRLIDAADRVLIIPDADKTIVDVKST